MPGIKDYVSVQVIEINKELRFSAFAEIRLLQTQFSIDLKVYLVATNLSRLLKLT